MQLPPSIALSPPLPALSPLASLPRLSLRLSAPGGGRGSSLGDGRHRAGQLEILLLKKLRLRRNAECMLLQTCIVKQRSAIRFDLSKPPAKICTFPLRRLTAVTRVICREPFYIRWRTGDVRGRPGDGRRHHANSQTCGTPHHPQYRWAGLVCADLWLSRSARGTCR